jgi:beta-lactamase class A
MTRFKAATATLALIAMPAMARPAPQPLRPPVATSVPAGMQKALLAQADRLGTQIGGRIGIAVRLLETGESAVANIERYPMASTYKVAIAGALLSRVDKGDVALDRMIAITQRNVDATGEVADHVIHPGVSLSVANLMELMLVQSNNTAIYKILALIGGPEAVTA